MKLGHQAPQPYRINQFNSIELNGDFAYCVSHNFIYDTEIEKEKLYNALPCYYTDKRYVDSGHNYFKNTHIKWSRFKDISLKACIRKVMSVRNIPINTIVHFKKSWYYTKIKIDNSFRFKVKKENIFDPAYQINRDMYVKDFTVCEFSKKLTEELRKNGFIVGVYLKAEYRSNDYYEPEWEEAIAYGHGKKVGFSSFRNNYSGYGSGMDYVLWDRFGEFNKWSQCNQISKDTPISEIVEILK